MARYECFRVEQFLNAQILELGSGEIDVTYLVVQKRDQNHPTSLNTYPEYFLVPNHGSTITPDYTNSMFGDQKSNHTRGFTTNYNDDDL